MRWNRYQDAESPYGKSVDALELVSGWRVQRLVYTALAAIVVVIVVVGVSSHLSGSVDTALAAGSYAAVIEALLMALLAMLSAVLA